MRQEVRPTAGLQPPAVNSLSQVSVQVATQAGGGGSARLCAGAACAEAVITAMRHNRKRQRRIAPPKFPNQPSWIFVFKTDGGIAIRAMKNGGAKALGVEILKGVQTDA
jgi:hypothetical protein